ncbi:MAG TPA: efflux RND transporter permease subunit, partial [Deltaproteobacteria bacterium]|nr:efflux RND transporter permease subunit [Deltaproteobacteria bacterium]
LTPMLSSIFLKPTHAHDKGTNGVLKRFGDSLERLYKKIEAAYRPILAFSLDHRALVLTGSLVVFVLSMYMVRFIGKEFVPPEDQAQFIVRLEAPIDYSFDQARAMFLEAEKIVRDRPEVVGAFFAQGMGQGGSGQVNKAVVFTRLVPRNQRSLKQHEIMAELRTSLGVIPGIKATTEMVSMLGGGIREVPIQYIISSGDMENLQKNTRLVMKELAKVPGIVDVDTSFEAGKPELKVFIDRDKAADLGVSVASIAEAVNLLFSGEVEITKFKDETRSRRYDVRMRLNPQDRMNPADLGRISVRSRDGSMVELSNIVRIEEGGGPTSISRYNRQRSIWVFANLENKPLAEAMDALDSISAKILPPDYNTAYVGQAETMKESFLFLMLALVLGIVLAYMVLASQFESFMHPVTVLLAMPLSFIGAFGALLITGKTISIVSFIGLILLMGLVKKNSILLVDYTNTLRERGMSRREAILQAGPVRLRPILMTTFAMIFGMLRVALGIGEGSDIRSPMGIIVIGGLLTSLFLTLAVVPAAYDTFESWKEWLWSRMKGRGGALSNMQGGGNP